MAGKKAGTESWEPGVPVEPWKSFNKDKVRVKLTLMEGRVKARAEKL